MCDEKYQSWGLNLILLLDFHCLVYFLLITWKVLFWNCWVTLLSLITQQCCIICTESADKTSISLQYPSKLMIGQRFKLIYWLPLLTFQLYYMLSAFYAYNVRDFDQHSLQIWREALLHLRFEPKQIKTLVDIPFQTINLFLRLWFFYQGKKFFLWATISFRYPFKLKHTSRDL